MEGEPATVLAAATAAYRGELTTPERWVTWVPRKGDILVCTPPKCGTTWTQTILVMLLHGGRDTPERIHALSPWVDAARGDAEEVARALERQRGRRVVKSHTPADGFPVWDGVTVIGAAWCGTEVRVHGGRAGSLGDAGYVGVACDVEVSRSRIQPHWPPTC